MASGEATVERAVREVYDAHFGRLVGWTTTLIGDRDLAHDVATEAFVKLMTHWPSVQDPRAWLYTAAANQVRDHWRKRGREAAAYDRFVGGRRAAVDVAAAGLDPATRLTVRDAVESLPERYRLVVLLHYYADLSVAQVAGQIGKSEGAVKRDLFDARRHLAESLETAR
ncbi:RNA polymerase sigma factor [Flexivirga sp. ID2601S]|uniref:RNA polymerase sigma factor n=1 Tax=Flexivirga aerilata TaxID=1656889 RepID=A0A849AKM6_9MICO|nr:RNA polymerase sigma factor [Flexivirga aerilata]